MSKKYLDESGLGYFWTKLKSLFASKADIDGIESGSIGGESNYNSRFINWEDSGGDTINLSVKESDSTMSLNKYDGNSWSVLWSQDMSGKHARFDTTPTSGKIVVTDGTDGTVEASARSIEDLWNFKEYSITRTANNYVNATNVARIKLYRTGRFGILYFNFAPSTSIPANTNAFEIGRFNCTLVNQFLANVTGQAEPASSVYVNISTSGVLSVGNYTSKATGTNFYRAMIPVIFDSTSA